jgi:GTPase
VFIDEAEISVRAGNGGSGIVSFHREKYIAKGGPDGGDGGRGGDVILVADSQLSSLLDFTYTARYEAESGRPGGKNWRTGKSAKAVRIRVPVGTVVHDLGAGVTLGDLSRAGQQLLAARGGVPGRGNAAFKGPTRQAPRFCEKGEKGEHRRLKLELKLLADVGLLGFPNAGKSSLLARVSAARPKIGDYPFTTLVPNLGVCAIDRHSSFVMADIPGLIEGASEGIGLGHAFLRHIERTRLLVHLVDVSRFERTDPMADFEALRAELTAFGHGLAQLPTLVALNKTDIADAEDVGEMVAELARRGYEVFAMSAATGEGVERLMGRVGEMVQAIRSAEPEPVESPAEIEPRRAARRVTRVLACDDGGFSVVGTEPERAVEQLNLSTEGGVLRLHEVLSEMGVMDALERLGARDGATVRIGEVEFDYITAAGVLDELQS